MWDKHRKWMLARMKAGRLAGGPGNPTVGMVKKPRWDRLETAVSSFEPYMKPEHREVWQSIKAVKSIDIKRR